MNFLRLCFLVVVAVSATAEPPVRDKAAPVSAGLSTAAEDSTLTAGAESPEAWVAYGEAAMTFDQKTVDGRLFQFSYRMARHKKDGSDGVIISLARPQRPPIRIVVRAADLPEFSDRALESYRALNTRGLFDVLGDLFDWAKDVFGRGKELFEKVQKYADGLLSKISSVWNPVKKFLSGVLRSFGELSLELSKLLESGESPEAAATYASEVRKAVLDAPRGTIARRMFRAQKSTVNSPKRAQALAEVLVKMAQTAK